MQKKEDIKWLNKAIELYNQNYSYLKIGKVLNINRKKVVYAGPTAIKIIKTIYKDATIYLDRKYDKINNLFAALSQNSQKT